MLPESNFKIIVIECTFFLFFCSKVMVPMYNLEEPCTKRCSSLRAHESEELSPRCIDPWAKRDGTPTVITCFHSNILKDQDTPSNRRRGFTYGLLPTSRVIYSNILLTEFNNGIKIRVSTVCLFYQAHLVNWPKSHNIETNTWFCDDIIICYLQANLDFGNIFYSFLEIGERKCLDVK